ncbi:FAD binding domain protein [Burkholderia thailandensis MSMB121]|nr:FAD binding domain protein [Burkholderia thailandensis MSMB121]
MAAETTSIDTLVVGAGQAGIAMSEHLSRLGVPHLVLERSRIAERWRTCRWDSLVANGPAWHDRFPGLGFEGLDPDAFALKDQVADYFEAYATAGYRNPGQLPDGGVLVVGAGSSGVQIADELRRAGRRVYLTVGPHDRPPRRYRNRAFCWWLGVLGESVHISLSSVKNRGIFAKYLSILVSRTWPARRGADRLHVFPSRFGILIRQRWRFAGTDTALDRLTTRGATRPIPANLRKKRI